MDPDKQEAPERDLEPVEGRGILLLGSVACWVAALGLIYAGFGLTTFCTVGAISLMFLTDILLRAARG